MCSQIRLPAHVDGMQSGQVGTAKESVDFCPQFVRSGGQKRFDGLGSIVAAQRELGVNRREAVELDHRIFREAPGQISSQCISPRRVPCKGYCGVECVAF
jgi:hypothetical protein